MTQSESEPMAPEQTTAAPTEPAEGVVHVDTRVDSPVVIPPAGHDESVAARGEATELRAHAEEPAEDQPQALPSPAVAQDAAAEDEGEVDDEDGAGDEDGVAEEDGADDEGGDAEGTPAPGQPGAKRAALENEGEIAADYLEELLDIADLDGDIDTFVEAGRPRVSILTDGDILVGRNGEVLEALQELCRLAIMTETGKRSRLMLDIAGHRDKRRRELEALAQDAVTEVKDAGEPVRLAPMNPFERKIVHDVVAAAGLVSESEGVEPQRRVVVLPA